MSTNFVDHISNLNITTKPQFVRLTSIVCTIGPACKDPITLERMLASGMNIARLNFSHGTHEYHAELIKNLKIAVANYSNKIGRTHPLGIAIDTKGSEIRTGVLSGGISAEVLLQKGDQITISTDKSHEKSGTKVRVYVDYPNITKVLKKNDTIYIDDGLITLRVNSISTTSILCTIEHGGLLGSSKGVNLPNAAKDLPTLSSKDKADIKFALEHDADFIFASFTRNAQEVREIRKLFPTIKVIAKIENQAGVSNMDEIIQEADGVLIDRGDLGMEISFQKVFLAQKGIIARCNKQGKPIIIATHFMESMVDKPRPTRAESADVANAVLDGADGVMLAGETAKGEYPVECVETMARICQEAEAAIWQKQLFMDLIEQVPVPLDVVNTTAIATVEASMNSAAAAIIVVTKTGRSAQLIARYHPRCPIIAVTRNIKVAKQLHLYRAILPLCFEDNVPEAWMENVDKRIEGGVQFGKSLGFLKKGDIIVIVTGWKQGAGYTNTLSLLNVE